MATQAGDASVYNANTNWDNERKYLNNLISSGQAPDWAAAQLVALESAHARYNPVTAPVTARTPQVAPAPALTGASLGDLYGLNYDFDSILDIFSNATQNQYAALEQDMAGTENAFYNNLAGALTTGLEALKQNNSAAIATGATQGLSASSALSLLLGLQQDTTDEATLLANDRNTLSAKKEAALAQNSSDALETSNMLRQAIAGLDLMKYGYDTEGVAAQLSYLAQIAAANAEVESAGIAADATKYVANKSGSGRSYTGPGSGGAGPAAGSEIPTTPNQRYMLDDGSIFAPQADGTYSYTAPDGTTYDGVSAADVQLAVRNGSSAYVVPGEGQTRSGVSTQTALGGTLKDGARVTYDGKVYVMSNGQLIDEANVGNYATGTALGGPNEVYGATLAGLGASAEGGKVTVNGRTYTYNADSASWAYGGQSASDTTMRDILSKASTIIIG